MSDSITVRGFAGTAPELRITESGLAIASFRLGSTPRWRSRDNGEWVSGTTNWYTIVCFQKLAEHIASSIQKGDPVVVSGRPRIRSWESENSKGTEIEIAAQGIGHDLAFGTSAFTKARHGASEQDAEHQGHDETSDRRQGDSYLSSAGQTSEDGSEEHAPVGAGADHLTERADTNAGAVSSGTGAVSSGTGAVSWDAAAQEREPAF